MSAPAPILRYEQFRILSFLFIDLPIRTCENPRISRRLRVFIRLRRSPEARCQEPLVMISLAQVHPSAVLVSSRAC